MTNHDKLLAVYQNQRPDGVPVGIYSKQLPRGYEERLCREKGLCLIDYYPITSMMGPPYRMGPGFLSEVNGGQFTVRYTWHDGQPLEIRTCRTRVGTVSQHVRKDPMYGSDWVIKDYIETPEDYKIMQFLIENSVIRSNEKALRNKIKEMGDDGIILGRVDRSPFQKLLIELANPQTFLMDILTGLNEAEELLGAMTQKFDQMCAFIADTSAEIIWQTENLSGDMTPPDMYQKYCLPLYKKLTASFDRSKKPFIVHTDGRMKPLLDAIAQSPIDGCESYSYPEMGNDITFTQARQAWPKKVLLPNFPASLAHENPETIREFMAQKLQEAGTEKAYMIQFSEDLPLNLQNQTLDIVLDFVNEYNRNH
jgi:hypothetical protein